MEPALISENQRAERFLRLAKRLLPSRLVGFARPAYHFLIATLAAIIYRFPSRKMVVVAVTGTKGKSTVVELAAAILRERGKPVASLSSLAYSIQGKVWPNTLKMTVPGRFKLQSFLRQAVNRGSKYLVLEMTSEAIKQHRHRFIKFDVAALVNLQPEHIEAHGSFEAYRLAKAQLFKIARKAHVLNADDKNLGFFDRFSAERKIYFTRENKNPAPGDEKAVLIAASRIALSKSGAEFLASGIPFKTQLTGSFNVSNVLCAISIARALEVPWDVIQRAVEQFPRPAGRLEFIGLGQPFEVVVDFAHTPDSIKAVYETLKEIFPNTRLIAVLGATGGGRDKWKRPVMGEIAARSSAKVFFTNEDPYDEDPGKIIDELAGGAKAVPGASLEKVLDRKEAIEKAIAEARPGDTVVITGKGGEQWMAVEAGRKIPWSDRDIAEVAVKKFGSRVQSK